MGEIGISPVQGKVMLPAQPNHGRGFGVVLMMHLGLAVAERATLLSDESAPPIDLCVASGVRPLSLIGGHRVDLPPSPSVGAVTGQARSLSVPGFGFMAE